MSNFNSYAKRLNEIAQAAFTEYKKAEAAYYKAEAKAKEYPPRNGYIDADYAAKQARAQAEFLEAKAAFDKTKRDFGQTPTQAIQELRNELAEAVQSAYSIDPAQLDNNTLELLKSGIMTANEYAKLMADAQAAGNPTMVRMIAKYADDAAARVGEKYGQNDAKAKELRNVAYQSRAYTGSAYLDAFDGMANTFDRCTRNAALIDHWNELTTDAIENF